MIDLGATNEAHFILAWLRAEIDSPRFGPSYASVLREIGKSRQILIECGDPTDEAQNLDRAHLLGRVRGYPNAALFTHFPADVAWRAYDVTLAELAQFLYAANVPNLSALSHDRRVATGAQTVTNAIQGPPPRSEDVERVWAVKGQVEADRQFPELIAVRDDASPEVVLIEGHTRATAYVIAQRPPAVRIILGASPTMSEWHFYKPR